ncbi:MAG: hypothetical protein HUN04_25260 [Desulfobacter sp.]|nr:MAG: hypothetical protein HUN04_25260 [Desulfobacter sp.]
MITSYAFGKMEINGKTFSSDLIIFPGGGIRDNWYRQSGHLLTLEDLSELTAARPKLIIAGTGAYGRMTLAPGLIRALAQLGTEIRAMETAAAVSLYNQIIKESKGSGRSTTACFHLTC